MEKVVCLNCNKPVDLVTIEGFYRCDCGTLNNRTAMVDMFMLKQQNYKKPGRIKRPCYWLIKKIKIDVNKNLTIY